MCGLVFNWHCPLFCFIFHSSILSLPIVWLGLCAPFLSFSRLAPLSLPSFCLSHCRLVLQCFPEDLTLWGYCVQKMILISAHCAELSCKLPFPHGDAAKRTGTNSLWHTIAWVLTEEDLEFAFQKEVIFSRLAVQNDIIIRWNFDLTKTYKMLCEIALSLWVKLLIWKSVWYKENCVWLGG